MAESTRYRVQFGWRIAGYTPTDSYITTPINNGDIVDGFFDRLVKARFAMVPENVESAGVRIGQVNVRRSSILYPPDTYTFGGSGMRMTVPTNGQYTATVLNQTFRSDQARSCIQVRVAWEGGSSLRYLPCVPDACVTNEPGGLDLNAAPFWKEKFFAWQKLMKGGTFEVYARLNAGLNAPIPIAKWVRQAAGPSLMGAVVGVDGAAGKFVGQKVQIKGVKRKGNDNLTYNGEYTIDSINTTQVPTYITLFLKGTEAGNPDTIKRNGTIQPIEYDFNIINRYTTWRGGVHKRGGSFGSPSGRRSNRQSLAS